MKQYCHIDPRLVVKDGKLQVEDWSVVRVEGVIDDDVAGRFSEAFRAAHRSGQIVIPVCINSPGGRITSLMAMLDEMESSRLPVATIVEGQAASAACDLAAHGRPGLRFAGPGARYMVHEGRTLTYGNTSEVRDDARELDRQNRDLFRRFDRATGKPQGWWLKNLHARGNGQWYLTARQARSHGLADHVRLPEASTVVRAEMSFG